jgi:phage-related minor tail protein
MAGTIKGITIELNGDTTKLQSALSEVNKQTKETQKELSSVNKALKFDPGNTSLLADKQRLLAERISETKSKLDALKQAQAQMDASGVDKNSEEYRKLQTEIDVTSSKLSGLQDQYKDFGSVGSQKLQEVGEKVKNVGNKMSDVGTTLTTHVTVPIVAGATASVAAWNEVDGAMDTVRTMTGATGDTLTDLQQRTKNIAETIPTDFQTASEAIGEVNTRFGLTGQACEDLSTQFVEFAQINNTDVVSSVDTVQTALNAFGLSADDAGAMMDKLTQVSQQSGASVDTLSQQLNQNAQGFQDLGMSASDSIQFLGDMEKSGLDVSEVLKGLKKVQAEAADSGKSASEVLTQAFSSSADAVDIFGTKAGPNLYDAMQRGVISMDDFTAQNAPLDEALGTTQQTFADTVDPIDSLQTTMNKLKDAGAGLADRAMQDLSPAFEKLGDAAGKLLDKFESLSPEQQDMILKFAAIAAVVGPAVAAVGKFTSGIGSIITTGGKVIGALSGLSGGAAAAGAAAEGAAASGGILSGALGALTSPAGIAVLAIGGIVTAGVLLYQNWDTIKQKAGELKDKISEKWEGIKQKTSETWENVKQTVSDKWQNMKETVANSKIGQTVQTVWETAKQNTQTELDAIRGAYDSHGGGLQGAIAGVGAGVQQHFQNTWNTADQLTGGKLSNIKNTVSEKMESAKSKVGEALSKVKDHFTNKLDSADSTTTSKFGTINSTVSSKMSTVKSKVGSALDNVKSGFSSKLSSASSTASSKFGSIKSTASEKMDTVKSKVSSALGNVKSSFTSKLGSAASTASSKFSSIKRSASEKMESVRSKVTNVLSRVGSAFSGAHWSLPKIKLPHIRITGKFSLNPPSAPHFGISWYDKGGIFNSPTVIGVGEKRPEFVGALDDLRKIVREESGSGANAQIVALLQQLVKRHTGQISITTNITQLPGEDEKALADRVSDRINAEVQRKGLVWA